MPDMHTYAVLRYKMNHSNQPGTILRSHSTQGIRTDVGLGFLYCTILLSPATLNASIRSGVLHLTFTSTKGKFHVYEFNRHASK